MKIAVLVSGGVDSSVALKMLKDQGHDVTAFYLKIWLEDELSYLGDCPWEADLAYVRSLCEQVGVPLEVVSMQKEYHDEIVAYTIAEVKAGRTPNPDVFCNSRIKFGLFFNKIPHAFEKVATGHYAQLRKVDGRMHLVCAPDAVKDQAYFLSHLSQGQLERALFPIGHLQKSQVRELAQQWNLPSKDRKDSQGICFLGKFKFRDFIKFHLGEKKGPIIELETGKKIADHNGFWFYTIGQRQGLGLGGGPWYVVDKDCVKNIVYISRNYYSDDKKRDSLYVHNCNWIVDPRNMPHEVQVKLRHGPLRHPGTLHFLDDGRVSVKLAQRDQGIAPGQFAVFYDNDVCLGSGIIVS